MSAHANRYKVARAFLAGNSARSGAMVSIGDSLYSYAHRLAQRWTTPDGRSLIILTPNCPLCNSRTTRTHTNAARYILESYCHLAEIDTTGECLFDCPA